MVVEQFPDTADCYVCALVDVSELITSDAAMWEVLASDRVSLTPDEPLFLTARTGRPGFFEISDGHHRVARGLRQGRTSFLAVIDLTPDDEPYEAPFFNFEAYGAATSFISGMV